MQSQSKKNIDRYSLRVGYVITGNEAVAHMWNIDRETGEQVDCTPFREEAFKQKTVYLMLLIFCSKLIVKLGI